MSVGGRVLADDALLHPDHPNHPYELHVWNKKQAKPVSGHAVAVSLCTGHDCRQCEVACGSFSFELPTVGGLERQLCCALSGQSVPLDLRIRVPIAIDARPWNWVEHPDAAGSDVVVWRKLLEIAADASDHQVELIQPRVAKNYLSWPLQAALQAKLLLCPLIRPAPSCAFSVTMDIGPVCGCNHVSLSLQLWLTLMAYLIALLVLPASLRKPLQAFQVGRWSLSKHCLVFCKRTQTFVHRLLSRMLL